MREATLIVNDEPVNGLIDLQWQSALSKDDVSRKAEAQKATYGIVRTVNRRLQFALIEPGAHKKGKAPNKVALASVLASACKKEDVILVTSVKTQIDNEEVEGYWLFASQNGLVLPDGDRYFSKEAIQDIKLALADLLSMNAFDIYVSAELDAFIQEFELIAQPSEILTSRIKTLSAKEKAEHLPKDVLKKKSNDTIILGVGALVFLLLAGGGFWYYQKLNEVPEVSPVDQKKEAARLDKKAKALVQKALSRTPVNALNKGLTRALENYVSHYQLFEGWIPESVKVTENNVTFSLKNIAGSVLMLKESVKGSAGDAGGHTPKYALSFSKKHDQATLSYALTPPKTPPNLLQKGVSKTGHPDITLLSSEAVEDSVVSIAQKYRLTVDINPPTDVITLKMIPKGVKYVSPYVYRTIIFQGSRIEDAYLLVDLVKNIPGFLFSTLDINERDNTVVNWMVTGVSYEKR